MSLQCEVAPSTLIPVRIITEAGWPVAIWEGNRRSTILGLVRSWQGQAPDAGESGWCVFYEVRVRDRGTLRLVLAVQSGNWYLVKTSVRNWFTRSSDDECQEVA